ncbi:MAG: dienelactone hydrolase family protein [Acidimicrobiales bacterium]
MRIELPSGTEAELVTPADRAPSRGLVVIPDIMSLRPLFDDLVAQLSDETGWAVCAFDLWPGHADEPLEWRLEHVGELHDDRVLGDAAAAAGATGAAEVGVIGFCLGGMYTLKAAGTGRFARAAAFYGMIRVPEQWRSPTQSEPLDALASPLRCPTMAIIGTADPWTPPEDVAALEEAGVTVIRYEGAEHGFVHDPSRPAHRPDDAADAWRRVLAFLGAEEQLSGRGG